MPQLFFDVLALLLDQLQAKITLRGMAEHRFFVELGGGVGDVLSWYRDGAYIVFCFR